MKWMIPQILMGASSSSKLGCWRKMSLEATQSCLISDSDSWTCFPGRANRTSVSRRIMSSSTASSIPCCCCPCCVLIAIRWSTTLSCTFLLLSLLSYQQQQQQQRSKGVNQPRVESVFLFSWSGSLCLRVDCFCLLFPYFLLFSYINHFWLYIR